MLLGNADVRRLLQALARRGARARASLAAMERLSRKKSVGIRDVTKAAELIQKSAGEITETTNLIEEAL